MAQMEAAGPGLREDALMGGRVRLRQPLRGYRAGLDAAVLAASLALGDGERALEAGCGAGAALLQVAVRGPGVALTGLERDPDAAALAVENVALNGLDARVAVEVGAIEDGFRVLGLAPFDAAFANPPFFDDDAAIRGPAPERRGAWIADAGLAAWLGFLVDAVRDGGRVTVVHRADRLGDILAALTPRAGSVRVRPVQPFADAPAKRVLVQAARSGRAPLVLLPPLVLHLRAGGYTNVADAILKGEAELGWEGAP